MWVDCGHCKDPLLQRVGLAPVGVFQALNKTCSGAVAPVEAFLQSHKVRVWTGLGHGK